jgi:hypothetical protein
MNVYPPNLGINQPNGPHNVDVTKMFQASLKRDEVLAFCIDDKL